MKRKIRRILFVASSILWLSGCSSRGDMIFYSSDTAGATYEEDMIGEESQESEVILVYVCGAVQEPGVVTLEADSRVVDAIALAGGMSAQADEDYVNLAARLTDGEKIYIPTKEETAQWESAEACDTKVNINTADKEALCTLPGIGESKAEDIINYRQENGSFRQLEELMNVPGIKENLFEKIADKIKLE